MCISFIFLSVSNPNLQLFFLFCRATKLTEVSVSDKLEGFRATKEVYYGKIICYCSNWIHISFKYAIAGLLLFACYRPQLWNLEVSPAGITFSGDNLSYFLIHHVPCN